MSDALEEHGRNVSIDDRTITNLLRRRNRLPTAPIAMAPSERTKLRSRKMGTVTSFRIPLSNCFRFTLANLAP